MQGSIKKYSSRAESLKSSPNYKTKKLSIRLASSEQKHGTCVPFLENASSLIRFLKKTFFVKKDRIDVMNLI